MNRVLPALTYSLRRARTGLRPVVVRTRHVPPTPLPYNPYTTECTLEFTLPVRQGQ